MPVARREIELVGGDSVPRGAPKLDGDRLAAVAVV